MQPDRYRLAELRAAGFPPGPIGGIMGHGRHPHHQARGRAEVRQLRGSLPRLRLDLLPSDVALEQAKALARVERDEPPERPHRSGRGGAAGPPRGRVESVDLARLTSRRHQVDSQMNFRPIAQRCLVQRPRSISESW